MTGIVTKIIRKNDHRTSDAGGYFFIRDEEGHDRFAHARDLVENNFVQLVEGARVTFRELNGGPRGNGLRAENVEIAC